MYEGKTLFAQVMDFLPWTTFQRIVDRYGGNHRTRTLSCAEQFRVMAFAQLTYRESLRDIEACLSAQAAKLYHMGFREPLKRSTLADANESRDWRIYADFAQVLIAQARKLYAQDSFGVDLSNTVYALDATTIDLCLSMFPWAPFRSTKAAVKMHTLLDLRGAIPTFIHISDGKIHDINVLDLLTPEPGAFYVMDRGYLDFERLFTLHRAGSFFVTRAKWNMDARRVYSAQADRTTGIICDQAIALNGFYSQRHYPEHLRRIRQGPRVRKDSGLPDQSDRIASSDHLRALQEPVAGGTLFQMDQTASSYQAFLWHFRECREVADLDRRDHLRARCHRQEAPNAGRFAVYAPTDSFSHLVRENAFAASLSARSSTGFSGHTNQPTEFIRFLTGQ